MNTRMMFVRAGDKCCQCENVASANSNSKFAYAKATADKLEIGNTCTMATLYRMFARGGGGFAAERFLDRINKIDRIKKGAEK